MASSHEALRSSVPQGPRALHSHPTWTIAIPNISILREVPTTLTLVGLLIIRDLPLSVYLSRHYMIKWTRSSLSIFAYC